MIGMGTAESSARRFAGGLSLRQFLGITCLFWVYVTLSNILYAYSMRTGTARLTSFPLWAPWDARLLQHLLLLPVVLVSFWASLRIQWRPLLIALPFTALMTRHSSLFSQVQTGHVPKYYILYGVAVSAITAITEETLVSGYLLTRLEQFGWTPQRALLLSLTLRTSYHVYYGLGFLFTIPVGYLLSRSFQKHHRLTRPIVAHFFYDAVLITISVLVS